MRTIAKESEVQSAVLELLTYEGIWAMRINTAAMMLEGANGTRRFFRSHSAGPGTADILALVEFSVCGDLGVCFEGFMPLWIECKNSIGRQSPEQRTFQEDVERRGHRYVIARSIDDVRQVLKAIRV